jgi:SAM-dependent methyltransferase
VLKRAGAPGPTDMPRVLRSFRSEHGEALEEVACPLCGSERSTLAFEARDLLFGKPGTYRLVRCDDCTLSYVNPRPTFASLGAHYPDNYHCYQSPEDSPPLLRPMSRWVERSQAMGRLKNIERVLGPISPDSQILDIGCGRNALLHLIQQKRGVTGTGVEMKREMVAHVRDTLKMPVVEGTLLDAKLPGDAFDLAIMLEYLEHDLSPLATLRETRRTLKRGGHVIIEIPDPEGWPARKFGDKWVNLDLPRHLVFFDRKTLADALGRTGFEVVSHHRFGIPGYIGMTLMLWLGDEHIMTHWDRFTMLAMWLGMPLAMLAPLMPEFSFVVARAV